MGNMVNFKYEYEYVSKMGPKVTLRKWDGSTIAIIGCASYDGTLGDKPIKNFPKGKGYKFENFVYCW